MAFCVEFDLRKMSLAALGSFSYPQSIYGGTSIDLLIIFRDTINMAPPDTRIGCFVVDLS